MSWIRLAAMLVPALMPSCGKEEGGGQEDPRLVHGDFGAAQGGVQMRLSIDIDPAARVIDCSIEMRNTGTEKREVSLGPFMKGSGGLLIDVLVLDAGEWRSLAATTVFPPDWHRVIRIGPGDMRGFSFKIDTDDLTWKRISKEGAAIKALIRPAEGALQAQAIESGTVSIAPFALPDLPAERLGLGRKEMSGTRATKRPGGP